MELQHSTVLVTGATGNMGPYVTDQLVNSDATVIGTYVTDTARDDVETRAEHADAVSYHQVDLTDQAAVEAFAETVADEQGSVDHIVALAGGFSMGGVSDTDGDAFQAALNRHATTAFLTVKTFADHLTSQSGVVLFSSDRAIDPVRGTLAYNVGKGAVRTLTELLDVELDARVNALAPFLIDVPGNREAMPDADFSEWTAPEAIVDEVFHLLTNEGVRGQIVQMTGGQPEVAP
ncbi:NAD(P)-dependent dehydrogenase, short-chain alcohol dehydrogenase family [Halogranum amylolyticum]|uniref:NAD(P)-dependent dehydrogenase, short-chain alcohol dehydrogenase family n=1 Tax=Halogranum amylolyticum TaxID=660520 RepID=A0A1H8V1C4_9EURY|nr:SDR family NAD(P)-dependent oxidoreductase [Halogranum amylolyticum]SEP09017.1 NAD(P)-dependent dehydrogenase, short-chain alcohol dehydrogenase family [Halogranum amylolyticum]